MNTCSYKNIDKQKEKLNYLLVYKVDYKVTTKYPLLKFMYILPEFSLCMCAHAYTDIFLRENTFSLFILFKNLMYCEQLSMIIKYLDVIIYTHRDRIMGQKQSHFYLLINCQIAFQEACSNLYFDQPCMTIQFPYILTNTIFFILLFVVQKIFSYGFDLHLLITFKDEHQFFSSVYRALAQPVCILYL